MFDYIECSLLNVNIFSDAKYTLLCGQDYRIGRADADILLATDKSISRSHAFLKITHLDVVGETESNSENFENLEQDCD